MGFVFRVPCETFSENKNSYTIVTNPKTCQVRKITKPYKHKRYIPVYIRENQVFLDEFIYSQKTSQGISTSLICTIYFPNTHEVISL
ncbi:unnamed protein product [Arabidopsis halleri]